MTLPLEREASEVLAAEVFEQPASPRLGEVLEVVLLD